nr:nitric oxide synthase, inducible-like [Gorilla gorilla gorilla]
MALQTLLCSEVSPLSKQCQSSEYSKWKFTNSPTFLELLEEFPSLQVDTCWLPALPAPHSEAQVLLHQLLPGSHAHSDPPDCGRAHVPHSRWPGSPAPRRLQHMAQQLKPQDQVSCFVQKSAGRPHDPGVRVLQPK